MISAALFLAQLVGAGVLLFLVLSGLVTILYDARARRRRRSIRITVSGDVTRLSRQVQAASEALTVIGGGSRGPGRSGT